MQAAIAAHNAEIEGERSAMPTGAAPSVDLVARLSDVEPVRFIAAETFEPDVQTRHPETGEIIRARRPQIDAVDIGPAPVPAADAHMGMPQHLVDEQLELARRLYDQNLHAMEGRTPQHLVDERLELGRRL